jgi:hypothetical protein
MWLFPNAAWRSDIFVHQSAKDFLVDRASSLIFPRGAAAQHSTMLLHSLPILFSTLRRNMHGSRLPSLRDELDQMKIPDPLNSIEYSCAFWVENLQQAYLEDGREIDPEHYELIELFLREKFLNWIEATSLLGMMAGAIEMVLRLEYSILVIPCLR